MSSPTESALKEPIDARVDAAFRAALREGREYGRSVRGEGRSILVEFVSAHPNVPLSAAHARGGVVGDIVAALQSAVGFEVQREFYVNDAEESRPLRAFGRAVLARYRQYVAAASGSGDAANPSGEYEGEMAGAFVAQLAGKIYEAEGDRFAVAESTATEAEFVRLALAYSQEDQREALDAFGIRFDHWTRESELTANGAVAATLNALRAAGYAHTQNDALWLTSTKLGDDADRALLRADGAASYLAADLAYHRAKFERGFARLIDVWSADHAGYVARTRAGLEALGFDPDHLSVVLFQSVRILKDGTAVRGSGGTAAGSASAASAVTLRELIADIGADAARFQLALRSPGEPIDLDLDAARRPDSPLHRVLAARDRAREAAGDGAPAADADEDAVDTALLTHSADRALLGVVAEFPTVIDEAARALTPQRIPAYALALAEAITAADSAREHDKAAAKTRTALFAAAATALDNALILIGIAPANA